MTSQSARISLRRTPVFITRLWFARGTRDFDHESRPTTTTHPTLTTSCLRTKLPLFLSSEICHVPGPPTDLAVPLGRLAHRSPSKSRHIQIAIIPTAILHLVGGWMSHAKKSAEKFWAQAGIEQSGAKAYFSGEKWSEVERYGEQVVMWHVYGGISAHP